MAMSLTSLPNPLQDLKLSVSPVRDKSGTAMHLGSAKKTKVCRKCDKRKRRDQFDKRSASNDGLQSYCKPCRRESQLLRNRNFKPDTRPVGENKTCSVCKAEKDLSEFHSGAFHCKECERVKWANYQSKRAGS